jgi:hypothetical protein
MRLRSAGRENDTARVSGLDLVMTLPHCICTGAFTLRRKWQHTLVHLGDLCHYYYSKNSSNSDTQISRQYAKPLFYMGIRDYQLVAVLLHFTAVCGGLEAALARHREKSLGVSRADTRAGGKRTFSTFGATL